MAVENLQDMMDALLIISGSERGAVATIKPAAAMAAFRRLSAFEQIIALVNPRPLGAGADVAAFEDIRELVTRAMK